VVVGVFFHKDEQAFWERRWFLSPRKLVPDPDELVWFIAEDFVEPEFSAWEATPRDIQAVLGECYSFEYYLIQQQFRWLLCENHHDVLIAVGKEMEERLNNYQGA
jgi:hypothetical protein